MEAGEFIMDAMPKIAGHANRWRLHRYWVAHGAMPQVISCTPAEPLHCENHVVYKTTKNQTRPRTQVCGAVLTYNSSELRGPTEVDGVPPFSWSRCTAAQTAPGADGPTRTLPGRCTTGY